MRAVFGRVRSAEAIVVLTSSTPVSLQLVRLASLKTHYQTLGVATTASQDEIRLAFLKLSKQLHPDVNTQDKKTHEKFVQVNEAYTTLSKQTTRDDYDRSLNFRTYQHQWPSSPYSSPYQSPNWMKYRHSQGWNEGHGEKVYWDDSINPKGSPDNKQGSTGDSYYGIQGLKRLPNWYIVAFCVGLVVVGAGLHYLTFSLTRRLFKKHRDEQDRKASELQKAAKEKARLNGNLLQIEMLKSKLTDKKKVVNEFPTTIK